MNYRHAYHAGNFADCFKHALLITLLDLIARKPAPYFVLDTHAGAGWYDLTGTESRLTVEAQRGIHRLRQAAPSALERYLSLVGELDGYPGSPALIRSVMRNKDRLACCELHPQDAEILRYRFRHDTQVEVHHRSGWEALRALLPPREKRGLIFIDPPFELRDEFATLVHELHRGYRRFRNGVFAAWYPIKQVAALREFKTQLVWSGIPDIITVEMHLRDAINSRELSGCGVVVINAPYQFTDRAYEVAGAVLKGVRESEADDGVSVTRLADE